MLPTTNCGNVLQYIDTDAANIETDAAKTLTILSLLSCGEYVCLLLQQTNVTYEPHPFIYICGLGTAGMPKLDAAHK